MECTAKTQLIILGSGDIIGGENHYYRLNKKISLESISLHKDFIWEPFTQQVELEISGKKGNCRNINGLVVETGGFLVGKKGEK